MQAHGVFWKLEALSNRQLLERLGSVLGSSRRLVAELIAHLGEVEERRLHLMAACSSMFAYCLKLGMTEDEAYRRIEVARLARRYPAIFPLLANGQLSLSVVALLRHHLSEENHLELLAAATGKSVAQTRELIATRFPRPDVASSVRKLPERRTMTAPSLALRPPAESASETESGSGVTEPRRGVTESRFTADAATPRTSQTEARFTSNVTSATEVSASAASADVTRNGGSMSFAPAVNGARATAAETSAPTDVQRVAPPRPSPDVQRVAPPPDVQRVAPPPPPDVQRVAKTSALANTQRAAPPPPPSRIEPLSAQRYKVQFTASAELARKLELARDLLRHCHPGGELGPIVERALDLLIESLMQRRFGKKVRQSERARVPRAGALSRAATSRVTGPRCAPRPSPAPRSLMPRRSTRRRAILPTPPRVERPSPCRASP